MRGYGQVNVVGRLWRVEEPVERDGGIVFVRFGIEWQKGIGGASKIVTYRAKAYRYLAYRIVEECRVGDRISMKAELAARWVSSSDGQQDRKVYWYLDASEILRIGPDQAGAKNPTGSSNVTLFGLMNADPKLVYDRVGVPIARFSVRWHTHRSDNQICWPCRARGNIAVRQVMDMKAGEKVYAVGELDCGPWWRIVNGQRVRQVFRFADIQAIERLDI